MDANGNVDGNLSVGEDELGHINAQMPPSMVNSAGANPPGLHNLLPNQEAVDITAGQMLPEGDLKNEFVSKIPRVQRNIRLQEPGNQHANMEIMEGPDLH